MGKVVVVEGPEKSGKTTLLNRFPAMARRHWGAVKPDDRVYAAPLREDLEAPSTITGWDRGWVSEYVYGSLLDRPRRGATDPWLLEWLHGRAVNGRGAKVILLPEYASDLAKRRDDTDLPVDPRQEAVAFESYGREFGYALLQNDYTDDAATAASFYVTKALREAQNLGLECSPAVLTMPANTMSAYTLVIGEARNPNDYKTLAGAWLPFASAKMTQFVRKYFGMAAFNCAWTNADDVAAGRTPPWLFERARTVIAFGKEAEAVVRAEKHARAHYFAHPAYFSRWNTDRGRKALKHFTEEFAEISEQLWCVKA